MMTNLLGLKIWAQIQLRRFLYDESGDVNIVSIVVLIGIAVLLAIVFKDAIAKLLNSLLKTITDNATGAVNNAPVTGTE